MILSQQCVFSALLAAALTASTALAFTTSSTSYSGLPASQLASTSHPDHESSGLLLDRREAFVKSSGAIAAAAGVSLLQPFASPASAATTNKIPQWTLENGVKFPQLALNTVGLSVEDTARALSFAVAAGVTHVDFHPGKERYVSDIDSRAARSWHTNIFLSVPSFIYLFDPTSTYTKTCPSHSNQLI